MPAPKGNKNAVGNSGGRPTEYNEEVLKKAQDYVKHYVTNGDVIPSIAGLAVHLGVAKNTLYNWAKEEKNIEFMHTLEEIAYRQENVTLNSGLKGVFNSTISKLVLANHGYHDKQQIESTIAVTTTESDVKKELEDIKRKLLSPDGDVPTPEPL